MATKIVSINNTAYTKLDTGTETAVAMQSLDEDLVEGETLIFDGLTVKEAPYALGLFNIDAPS